VAVSGILGIPVALPFFISISTMVQSGNTAVATGAVQGSGGAAFSNALSLVSIVVPFLILALYAVFVAETLSVWRCAKYIRNHVESRLNEVANHTDATWLQGTLPREKYIGWETWLYHVGHGESKLSIRQHDHIVGWAFLISMIIYFLVSVVIACCGLQDVLDPLHKTQLVNAVKLRHLWIACGIYALIGLAVFLKLESIKKAGRRDFEVN
jgi:heme/copper-type cytochrome/quinol oxidase subunit 2